MGCKIRYRSSIEKQVKKYNDKWLNKKPDEVKAPKNKKKHPWAMGGKGFSHTSLENE